MSTQVVRTEAFQTSVVRASDGSVTQVVRASGSVTQGDLTAQLTNYVTLPTGTPPAGQAWVTDGAGSGSYQTVDTVGVFDGGMDF